MKITQLQNKVSIKTSLGRIEIVDDLTNPKIGDIVAIDINVPFGVKIEGIGGKFIVLKKEKNNE